MTITNKIRLNNLPGDLLGGVTAAIVSLPLALAFSVASGAGAIAGLYGAVGIGFFAALFGGTILSFLNDQLSIVLHQYKKGIQ